MNSSETIIRNASVNDVEALAVLMTELGYPTSFDEMKTRFSLIQHDQNYSTFVATINDKVIGVAGVNKELYYELNGCYIRIIVLSVSENYRRFGVARKLITHVKEFAKQQGAVNILLNCGNKEIRKAAHQFYPSVGFEAKSFGYFMPVN